MISSNSLHADAELYFMQRVCAVFPDHEASVSFTKNKLTGSRRLTVSIPGAGGFTHEWDRPMGLLEVIPGFMDRVYEMREGVH